MVKITDIEMIINVQVYQKLFKKTFIFFLKESFIRFWWNGFKKKNKMYFHDQILKFIYVKLVEKNNKKFWVRKIMVLICAFLKGRWTLLHSFLYESKIINF